MKALKEVVFSKVKSEENYIFYREKYERYGSGDRTFNTATGKEIIEVICDVYGFDESDSTLQDFLVNAQDSNGEDDFLQIFELPIVK